MPCLKELDADSRLAVLDSAQTLAEASQALGEDVAKLIHEGPKEALALTTNTQPVMLVAGVAAYRVWLAGGGSARYQQRAQSQVQELGLQDQVRFLGVHRDVPSLLMARQIFVLSSHYEGMPLALVEAMAAGCALVGSAVPGVQEVIRDGHNGRLFAHEDAQALADILQHLLEHPHQAAALAAQGRADAFNAYSQAHMVAGYEKLLLSLTQAAS